MLILAWLIGCEPEPSCWVSQACSDDGTSWCATCTVDQYEGWIECSDGWSIDYGQRAGRSHEDAADEVEEHCEGG